MLSTTTPPRTKQELLRALSSKNIEFSIEEIATTSDRQKLMPKIDAHIRKSPVSVIIIKER